MINYLTPGVYVEEVPSLNKPIEGVATAVAAFVGIAPGGPINQPVRMSSWRKFVEVFSDAAKPQNGPYMEGAFLAHSVHGFFQNGGKLCYVVRVAPVETDTRAVAALPASGDTSQTPLRIEARPAINATPVEVDFNEGEPPKEGAERTYKLIVRAGTESEEHEGTLGKRGRTNLVTKVNQVSKLIKIIEEETALTDVERIPTTGTYVLAPPAAAGAALEPVDFEGDVATRRGMGGLTGIDEITMVCMPDAMTFGPNGNGSGSAAVKHLQTQMIAHCENTGDRMAILDAPPNLLPQQVLEWRTNEAGYDSKFAALYYPWVEVVDPLTNRPLMVPPSGHVAGIWCKTDAERGVHKAPANMVVQGASGLGFQVSHDEQGELNRLGINCIRSFPARGIRVWGARTLSSDPEWRYVNVRRLFNYICESIMEGTHWSVFEPNDYRLWTGLRVAVSSFLYRAWVSGALMGQSPEEAYFVKCDAETNPPEIVDAGQVVCEIGIAPVKPAEFVVFRLSQFNANTRGSIES